MVIKFIKMKLNMKMHKIYSVLMSGLMLAAVFSCENGDRSFPDYEGGTSVYFAYQYPVRTVVLGNDPDVNNWRDQQHKVAIYSTMGGSYGGRDITLDIAIDNVLCDNLTFEDGSPVMAMPESYYKLLGNQIKYNGALQGFVEVQLNDAFFEDEKALSNNYVIPVVIKNQVGADRILTGTPLVEGDQPARTNSAYWNVQPKDFVLYCVKYINPWDAYYVRWGKDEITENDKTTIVNRREDNVAKDEICKITTRSLTTAVFPVSTTMNSGETKTCELLLTFNGDNCTITTETPGISVSGTGKFIEDGIEKPWADPNDKTTDVIKLNYTINFGGRTVKTEDTLILQTRGTNKLELFTPKYNAN